MIFDTLTISALILTVLISAFLLSSLSHPRCESCKTERDEINN